VDTEEENWVGGRYKEYPNQGKMSQCLVSTVSSVSTVSTVSSVSTVSTVSSVTTCSVHSIHSLFSDHSGIPAENAHIINIVTAAMSDYVTELLFHIMHHSAYEDAVTYDVIGNQAQSGKRK
jgi:hypothetical protein